MRDYQLGGMRSKLTIATQKEASVIELGSTLFSPWPLRPHSFAAILAWPLLGRQRSTAS
jgi:hypothetical protein